MTASLEGVVYGHGPASSPVFDGFSHTFEEGEMVAVTGPSGAGKTTLLSLLSLLVAPQAGDVIIDGHRLSGMNRKAAQGVRQASIGMIFQTARVLSQLTVREHIRFARLCSQSSASEQETERLLEAFGLQDRLQAVPASLSGGERTRLASLLALAKSPLLLLADEPTASLDERNARVLLSLVREQAVRDGMTAVLVTHDPVAMAACDRSVVLVKA